MKKIKIIPIIIAILSIIGIIITCIWGLNFDVSYMAHKQIDIPIGQEFVNREIQALVKEIVGNQKVTIQKVELYEDMVSIGIKDISEEQLQSLNTKINEKYGIENTVENITVTSIPKVRGRDLIKPYIIPVLISFVITLIYLVSYVGINQRMGKDIKILKAVFGTIEIVLEFELLYLALLAITRLPVNGVTIPIAIIIYGITTMVSLKYLEKQTK